MGFEFKKAIKQQSLEISKHPGQEPAGYLDPRERCCSVMLSLLTGNSVLLRSEHCGSNTSAPVWLLPASEKVGGREV